MSRNKVTLIGILSRLTLYQINNEDIYKTRISTEEGNISLLISKNTFKKTNEKFTLKKFEKAKVAVIGYVYTDLANREFIKVTEIAIFKNI